MAGLALAEAIALGGGGIGAWRLGVDPLLVVVITFVLGVWSMGRTERMRGLRGPKRGGAGPVVFELPDDSKGRDR